VSSRTVGWQNGHDEEKILYATSLLRNNPGTWIPPYAEERIIQSRNKRQLRVIDAKGEASIRVKNMKEGKRSITEYWNEFLLVASEAELDNSTGGELLQGGMIAELQNASGACREEYEGLDALAQGAIRKETKLATVRHLKSTKRVQQDTVTPRNPDRTYRPTKMEIRTTMTLWNWTGLGNGRDSISRGKNCKQG